MKKYRCPKCNYIFEGDLDFCPSCKTKLHYRFKEEQEKEQELLEEEKTFRYDDPDVNVDGIKDQKHVYFAGQEVDDQVVSYFDGNVFQRFGYHLLGLVLTLISATILLPFAICLNKRWECKHTVINGFRLKFTGKARQLIGRYLLWLLLTILTVGIFIFWLAISMKRWVVSHTVIDIDKIGD